MRISYFKAPLFFFPFLFLFMGMALANQRKQIAFVFIFCSFFFFLMGIERDRWPTRQLATKQGKLNKLMVGYAP